MPAEAKFHQLYQKLNPAQREAVDQIDGPVLVTAGPGTGKTQILTLRIANILRLTDTPPDAILALTFTRTAVSTLRERLVDIMGSVGYRIGVFTFHGFCNEVIQRFPEAFPRITGAKAATRVDQVRLLRQILDGGRFKYIKPPNHPYYYLAAILSAIEKIKKENLTPAEFAKLLTPAEKKNRELARVYRAYEGALRQHKLYDFADMIMEVVWTLGQNEDLRLRLGEEYQYLLADEHQDANQAQNDLLYLLSHFHDSPNLFVVGDEKQAIFQFQGASADNFDFFRRHFPDIRQISLTDNYRSTKEILCAAQSLPLGGDLLKPNRPPGHKVSVWEAVNPREEYAFLTSSIKEKLARGVAAREIAVIYRDNSDAEPVIEALEEAGLPFSVISDADILNDPVVRKFLLILETVNDLGNDHLLARFLHLDVFGLDSFAIHRLTEAAGKAGQSLASYLFDQKSHEFKSVLELLRKWRAAAHQEPVLEVLRLIIRDSGFMERVAARRDAADKLEKLESLFGEVKNLLKVKPAIDLADFLDHLGVMREERIKFGQEKQQNFDGVQLLTAHKSKGLEFEIVYIVNAVDGRFGRRRRGEPFRLEFRGLSAEAGAAGEDPSAERRLFYVSLTRAKREAHILYARTDDDGNSKLPSRFIAEINPKHLVTNKIVWPAKAGSGLTASKKSGPGPSLTDRDYLRGLFARRGLSVTALNNYLRCPRLYYYRNLLRLPWMQSRSQIHGIEIHRALRDYFEIYRQTGRPPAKKWRTQFPTLKTYFQTASWPEKGAEILTEFPIYGVKLGRNIRLTGKIDRIDLSRGRGMVTDYKTGRARSRREILGETKHSTGDYWRQLVFYKILLERFDPPRFKVNQGVIDFVEADKKGRIRREEFELTTNAAKELTEQIRATGDDIWQLKFLERGCGKKSCPACQIWSAAH